MDSQKPREPYEAPVVEDVPLRTDEQVLAGCKTTTTNGPGPFSFFCHHFGGAPCQVPLSS
jgi:hypothetical protein